MFVVKKIYFEKTFYEHSYGILIIMKGRFLYYNKGDPINKVL